MFAIGYVEVIFMSNFIIFTEARFFYIQVPVLNAVG